MIILFENSLHNEAVIAKEIIEKVFGIICEVKQANISDLFKFKKELGGYEVQISKKYKNKVVLTDKNIFLHKAVSKEDDWIFGIATNQGAVIVSVARLKTNSDNLSNALKISKGKYKKRIQFIIIHELGHRLVKNYKHYKDFVIKNSKTGHKTNLYEHCPFVKCIMSGIADAKDLDEHIKINYKNLFCKKCFAGGFRKP